MWKFMSEIQFLIGRRPMRIELFFLGHSPPLPYGSLRLWHRHRLICLPLVIFDRLTDWLTDWSSVIIACMAEDTMIVDELRQVNRLPGSAAVSAWAAAAAAAAAVVSLRACRSTLPVYSWRASDEHVRGRVCAVVNASKCLCVCEWASATTTVLHVVVVVVFQPQRCHSDGASAAPTLTREGFTSPASITAPTRPDVIITCSFHSRKRYSQCSLSTAILHR